MEVAAVGVAALVAVALIVAVFGELLLVLRLRLLLLLLLLQLKNHCPQSMGSRKWLL